MKIGKVLYIFFAVVLFLAVSVLVLLFLFDRTLSDERVFQKQQLEFYRLGVQLENASNYLTDQSRAFVQSGDPKHYDNYYREVNETKTRETVVERLKEMGVDKNISISSRVPKTNRSISPKWRRLRWILRRITRQMKRAN